MKAKTKTYQTRGALNILKSYNFTDKDPVIEVVRTLVQRSHKSYQQIRDAGGPTPTCLYGWFDGKTRRPQFATTMATLRACGADMEVVTPDGGRIKLPKLKG